VELLFSLGVNILADGMRDPQNRYPDAFLAHLDGDGRFQMVREHLFAVSQAARSIAAKLGLGAAGATIGLVHDFGKYSDDFQQYLRRMALDEDTEEPGLGRGTIDHSTAGAQTIWRSLKSKGPLEGVVGEILAICVASHHSGLIDCIAPSGFDNLSRRMNKQDSESHFDEAWANAEQQVIKEHRLQLGNPDLVGGLRDTITRICQIDQNETIHRFKIGLLTRFLFSSLIDADRTDSADSSNAGTASMRQRGLYVAWPALVGVFEHRLVL
jgi:CRISPR-associated endonuclease/helicase Cas3